MTLGQFFDTVITFVDQTLIQVVFTLAFLVFFWGVYQYFIAGAADEEKRKKGRSFVIYGILGFVIMLSIWGIVNMIQGAFGLNGGQRPSLPLFGGSTTQQQNQNQNNPFGTGNNQTTGNLDCRPTGECPPGTTCAYSGSQAGTCIISNPTTDCRISTNQCPNGYVCDQNDGTCRLNTI